jgi:hypothetical protein
LKWGGQSPPTARYITLFCNDKFRLMLIISRRCLHPVLPSSISTFFNHQCEYSRWSPCVQHAFTTSFRNCAPLTLVILATEHELQHHLRPRQDCVLHHCHLLWPHMGWCTLRHLSIELPLRYVSTA